MIRLFVDMDGVLTDFDGKVSALSKEFPYLKDLVDKDKKHILSKHERELFWRAINSKGKKFWVDMEWMKDGKKLWRHVSKYDPIILTAVPDEAIHAEEGKLLWIKKEIGRVPMITCRREEKRFFASSSHILIDDDFRNVMEWKKNRGQAILHENASKTI